MGKNDKETEETLAMGVIAQLKSDKKMLFTAWILTLLLLFGTIVYCMNEMSSYDYVSQDGEGINNINTGDQGDLQNGAESQN